VYSFGIILWSVAQHLYLATHRDPHMTKEQHRFLMKPYGGAWVACRYYFDERAVVRVCVSLCDGVV
jgi:hypothetical protein